MAPNEMNGLEHALAEAGDGALVMRSDGRVVLWNRSAEKLLGYTAREVRGQVCCNVLAGRDDRGNRLCYVGCQVMALVKLGDPIRDFDMLTRTKNGSSRWLNVSTLVTANGSSGPLTVHLFRDVTATKELLRITQDRSTPPQKREDSVGLTRRELEILRLLAAGQSTTAMVGQLHVSPATVRNHVQHILTKLGVHTRLQAVAHATSQHLL
jgi:PAS domain S-box-containing protein